MERLIDADALIEVLKHLSYFNADDMQELVASQPTAYDVEKVEEQLEKASTVYDLSNCELAIRQDIALHIVRAGGKE